MNVNLGHVWLNSFAELLTFFKTSKNKRISDLFDILVRIRIKEVLFYLLCLFLWNKLDLRLNDGEVMSKF